MLKRNFKLLGILTCIVFICSTFISPVFAYDKSYTTYMAGNSHIDTAWQWTTTTTRTQYVPNTFSQAINLMNSNPDYTFNASASLHFEWLKEDNPTLYNSIKQKVASGQLNIVGGQYIEPDLNMPSGESLVRQSLFGQRFFQQEFGKKCTVGWVPDVFGFSGQMPQILKKSGMDYFVTTKLNWNDTNYFPDIPKSNPAGRYPFELFKWNGIDGSQVIVDKPRNDYSTGVDNANISATLDEPNRHGIKKGLVLWGSGDAGGGPTQSQIDAVRAADSNSTMPSVKMYTANQFFNDLTPTDKNNITDVWDGEMYFEYHRGTYTSQALIKKNNRLGEIAAEGAEKFSSMASFLAATPYPQSTINNAWELLLLNQFHDILPGSGTSNQVVEAQNNGATALNTLNGVVNNAVAAIASKVDTTVSSGVPIVVYNPLSFGRRQPVETSITFSSVPSSVKIYDNGTEIPSQVLSISGNTAKVVFLLDNIPSMGFKVVNAVANTGNYSGNTGLSIGSNVIENDLFRVEINSSTGNIKRIYDKQNAKEVLSGGEGNVLQILEDTPAQWDAWNVDYDDMTRAPLSTLGSTSGISIVEQGPVKSTYRINKSYGNSTFSQYITLYPGINRIDIRMTADWHESHKMLKVAFPFNVTGATQANYEIAYGTQPRTNQRDTDFNKARFEVPAHKWADLSNNGYGVSLLNNCKYGYDTYLNTMRLSLLRSPNTPDGKLADQGSHEFTYSVYPHSGDWKSANSVYKGYELNYPLVAYQTTAHTGTLGKSYSFMSVNQPNVIISAVKKAEDSSDYIIRMYESQGNSGTSAVVTLPGNIASISETNLLEENIGTPAFSGNSFTAPMNKFEIKTYKVRLNGDLTPQVPAVPTGLTATAASSSQINVSWGSSSGATSYDIELDGIVRNTTSTTYQHTGLAGGSTHNYRVRANNSAGSSPWSSIISATTLPPSGVVNVALNKTATANQFVSGEGPEKAVDGSTSGYDSGNSKWCSTASGDKWLRIDLGQNYDISRWVVKHAGAGGENTVWNTKDFKLQKSSDGNIWTDVDTVTGNTANITDRNVTKFTARYVRLYITVPTSNTDTAARIYEFEVYGQSSSNVTFYQNVSYGGTAVSLAPGNYTLSQLQALGIPNDWVSSIKVPSGRTVEIYQHDNYGGTKWTFTADDPNLVDNNCNDQMSSVKIY